LEQTTSSGTNATNETTGFPQYNQIESHMWSFLPNSSDTEFSKQLHTQHHNKTSTMSTTHTTMNSLTTWLQQSILASFLHQDDLFGVKRYTPGRKGPHQFTEEDPAKSQGSTQDI
jgi:hypothetical protein